MKRERVNKKLQNELQIAHAERQLAAAKSRVGYWDGRLHMLRNEQLRLSLETQLPLGPSTKKNKKKYVVWYSVRAILMESVQPRGMTTAELYQEICDEHPRLNIITFRAYLREFSQPDRGLLNWQNDRWHLAEAVRRAAAE